MMKRNLRRNKSFVQYTSLPPPEQLLAYGLMLAPRRTGLVQKIAFIFPGLFKDYSRTKLNFQGPPTRNVIQHIMVYNCTFPVQANRFLRLQKAANNEKNTGV